MARVPKTIVGLLDGALDSESRSWEIKGSNANGFPSDAPNTRRILEFLASVGLDESTVGSMGIGASCYVVDLSFLDGGVAGQTAEFTSVRSMVATRELDPDDAADYASELSAAMADNGVWVNGPRAALFVSLGLGLRVPRSFFEMHGLEGVTYEALTMEVRFDNLYRATSFGAREGASEVRIRIGEHAAGIDQLAEAHGAQEWAYVTAWNPRSEARSREENDAAQERLRQTLRGEGGSFLEGMSEPDDGSAGEASLLSFIDRDRAAAIARAFGQNAIVVGERGKAAELLWLPVG